MAKILNWDKKQRAIYAKWVASRPPAVRALIESKPPHLLYRLATTGHRVRIIGYFEDGTISVFVSGQFNLIIRDRKVLGVKPDQLTECDLPDPHEKVGAVVDKTGVFRPLPALESRTVH